MKTTKQALLWSTVVPWGMLHRYLLRCIASLALDTQWLGTPGFVLLLDRFGCVQIDVFLSYQLFGVDAEMPQHLADQGRFFLCVTLRPRATFDF